LKASGCGELNCKILCSCVLPRPQLEHMTCELKDHLFAIKSLS